MLADGTKVNHQDGMVVTLIELNGRDSDNEFLVVENSRGMPESVQVRVFSFRLSKHIFHFLNPNRKSVNLFLP